MTHLTYDAIVATRNRPEALALSIPLLLTQNRRPEKIIIVDSSDHPDAVEQLIAKISATSNVPIILFQSDASTTLQRNLGLSKATADVLFFPDDDSLVLPGALDAMMRVYERDENELIGGVCSAEAMEAPKGLLENAQQTYEMDRLDRLKQVLAQHLYKLENRFVPDPFRMHAVVQYSNRKKPDWLNEENAVVVEWMTGFRMSFRAHLIRMHGFDEILERYALAEDIEAGFQVMKTHFLVGARNAQIFHYRFPGARGSGRAIGATHLLNRAYVVLKHAGNDSLASRHLRRFSLYKIAQYATRLNSQYGRDRFAGAVAAYRCIPELLSASPDNLANTYKRSRSKCLDQTQD